ncbi:MAG: ABC transporter ATP-binding protein [Candidatus Hydrogenedentota bacterium]|nr:MAG: ABC transporter ATP-binding protein [Candidatus Hydrogenedentota bacterium]
MKVPIEARELTMELGSFRLGPLSLRLPSTSLIAVTGPSGAGKSTLLLCLAGAFPPTRGQILFRKINLASQDDQTIARLRRETVGLLPQETAVLQEESLFENLLPFGRKPASADAALLRRWLDAFRLPTDLHRKAGTLSGGEQRRLDLVRVFLSDAPVLILDEPFAMLDESNAGLVRERILEQSRRRCVICSLHDDPLLPHASMTITLAAGKAAIRAVETPPPLRR